MSDLRAAVVGCGSAGLINHIPWYALHEDVDLVAVVDADLAKAERAAKQWGSQAYTSVADMLAAKAPDLVSIATPVHLHAPQTAQVLDAGCHVLCEKPMARTVAECQEMIDRAQHRGG